MQVLGQVPQSHICTLKTDIEGVVIELLGCLTEYGAFLAGFSNECE